MYVLDGVRSLFSWKSIVDIFLVAILFYQIISMLKGTRAAQILIGMLVIFITYVFSSLFQLETLHWLISKFFSSFLIMVIVLFQDDIRRLLSQFGKGAFFSGLDQHQGSNIIEEVINASKSLSHERIGALIVFERSIGLNKLHDHGVKMDALISEQLLTSVFQSFSPLHDGAVIIQKNKISCASAQLPLSKNPRFSKKLGTRHSAAVGISEETDAVVLVVSEETGGVSIAWEGHIQKQPSLDAAKKMLYVLLMPRGQPHAVVEWLEEHVFFRINQWILKWNRRRQQRASIEVSVERRQNPDRRVSSLDSLARNQVEYENRLAARSPHHIHIQFHKHSKIKEMLFSDHTLVMSQISRLSKENIDLSLDEEVDIAPKSLNRLTPDERFDPPIPSAPPPRDVVIGGVSLNPPKEEKSK